MAEPFLAQITMFAGNFAPRGWAFCDGQILPIASNSALFSLLGTTYGGDGRTTFGLPDLRGRVSMHPGNGPGLSQRRLGEKSGQENSTLTVQNLAPHTHQLHASEADADSGKPNDHLLGTTSGLNYVAGNQNANMSTQAVGNTGNAQAFTNLQPFTCVNYIIALTGVFPSRS